MSRQVFISYSRKDGNDYAEKLQTQLESAGFTVWRDTRNINPAQDFTAEIETGIEQADIVAVCVTPDIKRANSFVRREIQYAATVNTPAFPCRFVDITPTISIINNEWLEFYLDWGVAFQRLCQLVNNPNLNKPSGTYQQPPDEPFKDYLQALYRQIVRYLDQVVIRLIDLEAQATPEAVPKKRTDDILLEFFESSIFATPEDDKIPSYKTFADAFEYHNGRLLLLGEPGAGKTITLMSHARDAVAARLDDTNKPLPILKIVATWQSHPPMSITDWCTGEIKELKPEIESGRALLLLDGLDELGGEREISEEKKDPKTGKVVYDKDTGFPVIKIIRYDPRKRFVEAISQIKSNNKILVSCRVHDYAIIGQQIALDGAITLRPLNNTQLADYLENHPQIYSAIQNDDNLRELARTPLLLSLITFAFNKLDENLKTKGELNAGDVRDAIFEAYCRQRYDHEAKKLNADLPFSYQDLMDILGELAMWNANDYRLGINQRSHLFTKSNVLIQHDFEVVLKGKHRILMLQKLTSRLNILIPINQEDYRFSHLLLRDFLAYTFALPRIQDEKWWNEDSRIIANPINALANISDARAITSLITTLENESWIVQTVAIRGLERIGNLDIKALLLALQHDNEQVRANVVKIMGNIENSKIIRSLIALLDDKDEFVRWGAIESLGNIGNHNAIKPLIALLDDKDEFVRWGAIASLTHIYQRIGNRNKLGINLTTQLHPLMGLLYDFSQISNNRICDYAYVALQQIGTPQALKACEDWIAVGNEYHPLR